MTDDIQQYFEQLEAEAWESYRQARFLYHIARHDINTHVSILREGLKGSHDEEAGGMAVWFFTDKDWAGAVAESLMMQQFDLYRISKDAVPKDSIRWDNVGEFAAARSFYALLDAIPADAVRYAGSFKVPERYRVEERDGVRYLVPNV
jgi:hypothetical protein